MLPTTTIDIDDEFITFTFETKQNNKYQSDGLIPSFFSVRFRRDDNDREKVFNPDLSELHGCDSLSIVYHNRGEKRWERSYSTYSDPSFFKVILDKLSVVSMYESSFIINRTGEDLINKDGDELNIINDTFGPENKITVISRAYLDSTGLPTVVVARLMKGKLHCWNGKPALLVVQVRTDSPHDIYDELYEPVSTLPFSYVIEERWYHGKFISSYSIIDELDEAFDKFELNNPEIYVRQVSNLELLSKGTHLTFDPEGPDEFISSLKLS